MRFWQGGVVERVVRFQGCRAGVRVQGCEEKAVGVVLRGGGAVERAATVQGAYGGTDGWDVKSGRDSRKGRR